MAVDQLLTNQPVRPWHFVYFIGYSILYLIWSAIFFVSGLRCDGERYIYETCIPASSPSTPVAATPQRTQAQLEEI